MSSVTSENTPFGTGAAYHALSPPNSFGGAAGYANAGVSVAPNGGFSMPPVQKDSVPTSNRTIPYSRVVMIDTDALDQLNGLKYGDLALLGARNFTGGRDRDRGKTDRRPTRGAPNSTGVDSPSKLATTDYVEGRWEGAKPIPLKVKLENTVSMKPDAAGRLVLARAGEGGDEYYGDLARSGVHVQIIAENNNIFESPKQGEKSCFLWVKDAYLVTVKSESSSAGDLSRLSGSGINKRQRDASLTEHAEWVASNASVEALVRPKIPSEAANHTLGLLLYHMSQQQDGPMPFNSWTPDGIVMYKYETADGNNSNNMNPEALNTLMDRRQGAMFNIAVAGPATTFAWTSQKDMELSRRCLCLPRNMYYLLVVATFDTTTDPDQPGLKELRYLNTTSYDLNQHAHQGERMSLKPDEVIIGGWQIGSVIDNSAAPMASMGGGAALNGPQIRSGTMGARIAVSIKFVSPFDLHMKYWSVKKHPQAQTLRSSGGRRVARYNAP